ncbi:hypothetical protein GH714_020995 [Hevea brasiliensis]|uniref:Protein kinase domain-containing protein n=1 Tax=Hevea brasiliensis TaxID=3981 RepID=A0A6A6L8L1_HEVBR|nr:hypothetical protein GH714_020892 [Hevea brasiliensis]KAF2297304.1 hypothetical protein GH714_020995 [Hevea brasiliensis]
MSLSSSSNSTIVSWRFSSNGSITGYKRIYEGPAFRVLEAGNSLTCGIVDATNRLECWPRRKFKSISAHAQSLSFSSIAVGEDFVCGLLRFGNITCFGNNPPVNGSHEGNFSMIAAGFRHACALTFDYELQCWGESEPPRDKFKLLALGENRSCGLRLNDTVVCWGQNNFSLQESLKDSYFVNIEAKRNIFCGVRKENYSLVCWGNEILDSNLTVFDEVIPGPCTNSCQNTHAMLAGSGKFCPQGFFICHDNTNTITPPPPTVPPPPAPPLAPCWPPSTPPGGSTSSEWSNKMIAFLVVGCVGSTVLLLAAGFFVLRYCKCRGCRVHDSGRLDETGAPLEQGTGQQQQQHPQIEQAPPPPVLEKRLSQLASMGNAGHLEEFPLQLLLQATNNFSEDHKVGTGSFGSVYRGTLEDGREVAIKRAETSSTSSYAIGTRRQEDKDNAFINELESLSRLHHKNLIRLLGFCEDCNERVLVYEYLSNGTLHDHLHKLQSSPLMSWTARIKVALDAARGIEYLHEYAVPPVIHRDIKSSNILLDSSWNAKVSDFGLSLMGPDDEESHLSLRAAGTVGYMDPEYYRLQQLTTKSDVYSFGIVLLELLSGIKAIHKNENGTPRNVVDFVVPFIVHDEIHRALDSRVPPPTPFEIEAVAYVGYLAADCVTLDGRDRPPMTEIVNSLERALAACLVHPTSLSRSTTGSST